MATGKTEGLEGSLYQQTCDAEVITKFRPLLINAGYALRDSDGKIEIVNKSIAWDTPWHHIVHDAFLDCLTWHTIMFNLFSKVLPQEHRFVPSACQQCWKVVVRPKTLLGLFALMHLQVVLQRPSKCGIEVRPYVHGLYGGYFYNHSLEEGVSCYKIVRDAVDSAEHLGKDIQVILKRSCTEMEMECGPSDKWIVSDRQLQIESSVNRWFVKDGVVRKQPDHAIAFVHRAWIEWAYQNGDATYLNFTNGKPLYRAAVTYHHLLDETDDERSAAFKKFSRANQQMPNYSL